MFGQLIIGPPGSGKTTYCMAVKEYLAHLGRSVSIVNLDPANERLPYTCAVDMSDLVRLEEVMETLDLGPNGGLLYCMEYLTANVDWLDAQLAALPANDYLLIDCPGQVELYTQYGGMRKLVDHLTNSSGLDHRLCAVHLVDSVYCADPGNFISALLVSLSAMLQLGLPHVNVLSKADLIDKDGRLPFNVDFFTDVLDLSQLVNQLNDDPFFQKFKKFNEALIGIIEDRDLVSFTLLDIQDKDCMARLSKLIDKANGYVFGSGEERNLQSLLSSALGSELQSDLVGLVQEKYVKDTRTTDIEEDIDFLS